MKREEHACPGTAPENETTVLSDPKFIEQCKIDLEAEALGWRFGASLLTRSDNWGLIWRADILTRRNTRARVAIWRRPGTNGFGTAYFSKPFGLLITPKTPRKEL
jgi:hypothetical protein